MRLVCPNCDAEYEVEDGVIPSEGRDVQCSNCTTTWFQAGAGADQQPDAEVAAQAPQDDEPDDEDADTATIAASVATATPRRPDLDQAALDIIHEEVARETSARAAERGGIETQPDLGLDDNETQERASAARDRMARRRGLPAEPETIEGEDDSSLAPAPKRDDSGGKKELLPDIEEINSTLSPETVEAQALAARQSNEHHTPEEARRSSFRLGFGLMLLLALCLLLLYIYAGQISARMPALSGFLASYTETVDSLRVALDAATQGLVEQIGTILDGQ